MPVTLSDWNALTLGEAFALGKTEAPRYRNPNLGIIEAREAVDNWTEAQTEHAHTSFYGAHHIQVMRAYWLGRLRATRNLQPCRACATPFPYDPDADYCPACAAANAGEES